MTESDFTLHPQLESDSLFITDLPLSRVLLINDSNYPWVLLVPRRTGATAIYKLSEQDQSQLFIESARLCNVLEALYTPDKINVAAIGNMVPQLHLHHIVRFKTDIAWPAPVWGFTEMNKYDSAEQVKTICKIRDNMLQDSTT